MIETLLRGKTAYELYMNLGTGLSVVLILSAYVIFFCRERLRQMSLSVLASGLLLFTLLLLPGVSNFMEGCSIYNDTLRNYMELVPVGLLFGICTVVIIGKCKTQKERCFAVLLLGVLLIASGTVRFRYTLENFQRPTSLSKISTETYMVDESLQAIMGENEAVLLPKRLQAEIGEIDKHISYPTVDWNTSNEQEVEMVILAKNNNCNVIVLPTTIVTGEVLGGNGYYPCGESGGYVIYRRNAEE